MIEILHFVYKIKKLQEFIKQIKSSIQLINIQHFRSRTLHNEIKRINFYPSLMLKRDFCDLVAKY